MTTIQLFAKQAVWTKILRKEQGDLESIHSKTMPNYQNQHTETLKARLAALEADPQHDRQEEVEVINALAKAARNVDAVKSQRWGQRAYQLATTLEPAYQSGILHSLVNLGWANY
jgi:hypothetical protein